jgi:citrate synthase
MNLTKFISVV